MTTTTVYSSQGLSLMALLAFVSCVAKRSTAFSIRPAARPSLFRRLFHRDTTLSCSPSETYSPDDFIQMQKSKSNITAMTDNSLATYLQHQQAVFDEMSNFFASDDATPPQVVPAMKHLAHCILKRNENAPTTKLMDVGCGTGALFPFYLEAAKTLHIGGLQIKGVDLSPKMAALARQRAENLLQSNSDHSITVTDSDFVTLMETNDEHRNAYDVVVANACFGNFFDTDAILAAMASCLKVGGMLFITHPLGADFVQKLHQEDPSTVPHLLPTRDELENTKLALKVVEWQQEDQEGNPIYLAGAVKVPYQQLPQVLRFRGTVDSGYGRGGKRLGFPTANLPESLFFNALENVSTGVYFGWAVVEGRDCEIHKAAVNVGYSPTFEGKENTEKIIEAHLIPDEPLEDFYGETMRLALCGFLRPEQKFDSFPDLMAAITNDVSNAKEALTVEPYASLQADSFLVNANEEWIGTSGGDATASWEFQDLSAALEEKSEV